MERLPLFVFGTLRRGEWNHHYLAGRYQRVLESRLHDYAKCGILMIAPREGGRVDGELFFLDPERYDETLRQCDDLEGIAPGKAAGRAYRRLAVEVSTGEGRHRAWAYVRAE